MKLGFVTCVQLGLSCMEALYEAGGELCLAITLKDEKAKTKSGRVYLDNFCNSNGIELYKIDHVNDDEVHQLIQEYDLDWLFIIGWSQIANKRLLDSPKNGVLGMHPTLLPVGRGRAAIPWAIIKELDKTGVTLFKLDKGVDTGPILSQFEIPLSNKTTSQDLYQHVDSAHISLMKQAIPLILKDDIKLEVQDETKATIWDGRNPQDGEININGSKNEAEKLIRAVTKPYPGAFIFIDDKKHIVWSAQIVSKRTDGLCIEFSDGLLECLDWEIVK